MSSGSHLLGIGGELGWAIAKNLRVAAGYNVFGFRDDDLSGVDHTDRGPYFNFGLKIDETWFDRGARKDEPGGKEL